jgi:hypothetical protein
MKVHEIIYNQIGGGRAFQMLGASNAGYTDKSLGFRIKGCKKVNHVNITLNSMDLYDIKYIKIHGTNIKTISESNNIYNDMLKKDIEQTTGLYLNL